jgi:hypothetical protein
MTGRRWKAGVLALTGLASLATAAEGAYITDKLLAGLYAAPTRSEEPLKLLPSGTPLEILGHRGGFSRVRLTDHQTGWVESTYVTMEKPARVMLLEAQATAGELRTQLDEQGKSVGTERPTGAAPALPTPSSLGVSAPSAAPSRPADTACAPWPLVFGTGVVLGLVLAWGWHRWRPRHRDL